jgi:hypothetical protein
MLPSTNLLDLFFQIELKILQKVYIVFLKILHDNSIFWSVIWKYGRWSNFLKVLSEIIGFNFSIYEKLKLVLMCRFIHYISEIWFFFFAYQVQKVTVYIQFTNIICSYAHTCIVRRHAQVSDLCNELISLIMVYPHRQANENPFYKYHLFLCIYC